MHANRQYFGSSGYGLNLYEFIAMAAFFLSMVEQRAWGTPAPREGAGVLLQLCPHGGAGGSSAFLNGFFVGPVLSGQGAICWRWRLPYIGCVRWCFGYFKMSRNNFHSSSSVGTDQRKRQTFCASVFLNDKFWYLFSIILHRFHVCASWFLRPCDSRLRVAVLSFWFLTH